MRLECAQTPSVKETLPLSESQAFTHMEGPFADRSEGITHHICIPRICQGMKYIVPHQYQQERSYPQPLTLGTLHFERYLRSALCSCIQPYLVTVGGMGGKLGSQTLLLPDRAIHL